MDLQILSVTIGIVTLFLVAYQVWRNLLVGPEIKVSELRCLGHGGSDGVPITWTWQMKIRNDGSRSGEIRDPRIDVFEIRPESMNSRLEIMNCFPRTIYGFYQKGEAQQLTLTIAYKHRSPESCLAYRKITKLVAVLKWNKETRDGFAQESLRLSLVP